MKGEHACKFNKQILIEKSQLCRYLQQHRLLLFLRFATLKRKSKR